MTRINISFQIDKTLPLQKKILLPGIRYHKFKIIRYKANIARLFIFETNISSTRTNNGCGYLCFHPNLRPPGTKCWSTNRKKRTNFGKMSSVAAIGGLPHNSFKKTNPDMILFQVQDWWSELAELLCAFTRGPSHLYPGTYTYILILILIPLIPWSPLNSTRQRPREREMHWAGTVQLGLADLRGDSLSPGVIHKHVCH